MMAWKLTTLLLVMFASAVRGWWNEDQDRKSAYLAFSSYCPEEQILKWDCKFCNQDTFVPLEVVQNNAFGTRSYIGIDTNTTEVVVVFRGSANLQNWIEDLFAVSSDPGATFGPGRVHTGFLDAYNSVNNLTLSHTQKAFKHGICSNGCGLKVVGHSLGGAMAVLFTANMLDGSYKNPAKYTHMSTFGCPRVGNPSFAHWFTGLLGKRNPRTVHRYDPVPHLPFEHLGFRHYPTEVWEKPIGHSNRLSYHICDGSGEDKHCSDHVLIVSYKISDHVAYFNVPTHGLFAPCGGSELNEEADRADQQQRADELQAKLMVKYASQDRAAIVG